MESKMSKQKVFEDVKDVNDILRELREKQLGGNKVEPELAEMIEEANKDDIEYIIQGIESTECPGPEIPKPSKEEVKKQLQDRKVILKGEGLSSREIGLKLNAEFGKLLPLEEFFDLTRDIHDEEVKEESKNVTESQPELEDPKAVEKVTKEARGMRKIGYSFQKALTTIIAGNVLYKRKVSGEKTIDIVIQEYGENPPEEIPLERYHVIEPKGVLSYPDPVPLFEGFPLYEMLLNILSGEGGHFKSIAALEIITSLVTGKPLFGKYEPIRTGKVLLIDEETPYPVLKERITKFGLLETDLLKMLHFQNVKMDKESDFLELMNFISSYKPILVLFDSLTRLHSKNENASGEMSGVMNNFRKIANTGPCVLTIHHFSKEGKTTRGSTDIVNSVDYEFTNVHSLATNLLTLGIGKCRYIRVEDSILQPRGMRLDYFKTKFENEWDTVGNLLRNLEEPLSVREIIEELSDLKISEFNLRKMLKDRVTGGLLETKETEVPYVDKIGRNRIKKVNVYGIKV